MAGSLVQDKVVLITGAGSGIGRATAHLSAEEGALVVVAADLDPQRADETARSIAKSGGAAWAAQMDVTDARAVEAVIANVLTRHGRLDCAVNNAGIQGRLGPITSCTDADWRAVMAVNLDGVFHCLRAEIPALAELGGGAIVNVASGVTIDPVPGMPAYVASKFAVLGLTRTVAGEVSGYGIRVNAVLPGGTRTEAFDRYLATMPDGGAKRRARMPMGRFGEAREVADAIVWLCSDRAAYVHGATLAIDGGQHGFANRQLDG